MMGQIGGKFGGKSKRPPEHGSFNRWSARYTMRPTRTRIFFADGCWATKDDTHAWDVFGVDDEGRAQFLHEGLDMLELLEAQKKHGFKDRLTGTSYASDDPT